MAIGPLADFNANVLQKLTFLQLIDVEYPNVVEMFLTLVGNIGQTDSGEVYDETSDQKYASSIDEALNLEITDKKAPKKFMLKGISPIFIKASAMPIIQLLVIYFISVLLMILDRRYKHFDKGLDDYAQESNLATFKRQKKYILIKGLKQKFVWKNFLRAFMTAYQPIMIVVMLNIKQASLAKPILGASAILSAVVAFLLLTIVGLLGWELYKIHPRNFPTDKALKKQIRLYFEGIIKPFDP
jgi:hypothetical protein